ncbi:MAG: Ig-like domain-containing protein [Vicinamibacterales bacterium]
MPRRLPGAITLALLVSLAAVRGFAGAQPVPSLLAEAASPAQALALDAATTVQARAVRVDPGALAADAIDVAVTPDRTLRTRLERRSREPGAPEVWSGVVEGQPLSSATFVRVGTVLQGSIRTLDAAYSIEPLAGADLHVVRQVSLAPPGIELPPRIPPSLPIDRPLDAPPDSPLDDGTTFDVLVVYNAAARTAAGGSDAAIQGRITLGINETNTAYANSGIIPRLRLVGTQLVTYTESGNLGTDLDALTGTTDGQMDSVHTLRNTVGADLVQLVVGSTAGGACGVAWLMESLSSGFATHAFSVTAEDCISPNYTFGHEMGHNMGSNHAADDPVTSTPLYAYSFGYKNPGQLFRTVMAYNCSGGCPRVLYFSNPSVTYGGQGAGTGLANNATSINNARTTSANWRAAVGPNTAPTISTVSNQTINEDTASSTLGFTVGDGESSPSSLVVTASSSNTAVVGAAGLALGGSGSSRTIVVTPQANASGSTTVTLTVSDGVLSASSSFTVTVTPVNDAPTVTVTPAAATTPHATPAQVTVVVSDIDTAGASLTLTPSSLNTTILPGANISAVVTATAANSRTWQVTMTPVSGQQGAVSVTMFGSDGVLSSSMPFVLTVLAPAAPTITPVQPQSTYEDTATAPIPFTVADTDSPLGSVVVTASSSNPVLVPNTLEALALGGAGGSRTITVTPAADQYGITNITLTASDGVLSSTTSFALSVFNVNDAPTVDPIGTRTTDEDTPLTIAFNVADVDTPVGALSVQATSSNTALVDAAGLVPGGRGASRSLAITPRADQNGEATITVSVNDGSLSGQVSFTLSVTPVNDAPVVAQVPPIVSAEMNDTASFPVTVTDIDTAGAALTLAVTSSNPALLGSGGISVAPTATGANSRTFLVTLTPEPGQTGSTTLGLTAGDTERTATASTVFNVTATPVAPDPPTALAAVADGTNVRVEWTPALTGAAPTSSVVEIGSAPGTTTLPTQSVAWPATALDVTLPEGTYYVRVRSVNAVGASAPSPETSVTVVEPDPIPGPPAAFSATTAGRTARFTWLPSGVGAPAASYRLEAGSGPGLANITAIDTGSTATSLEVQGVPPGTYWVRIRGANAAGVGAPSQDMSIVMGAASGCVGLPAPPVLLPPVVTGNTVTLSWNAPAAGGTPSSYVLMAGSAPGASNLARFGTGNAATSYAASAPDGLYFVRIAASNACGTGAASNEVRFNLGPQPPDAPASLAYELTPGRLVTLTWDAPATGAPVTGYMVEAGSASGLGNLAVLSTGSTATSFSTVAPPGTYFVRVYALNSAGAGVASNEVVIVVP